MSGLNEITPDIIYTLGIETTKLLIKRQDQLTKIIWNDGESNLDTEYSDLACECCMLAWETMKPTPPEYSKIEMSCIKPDINITFTYLDGSKSKHKIELKSSKGRRMPGSTIKKLDINQTLIYCLRPSVDSEPYKLRCSQYYSAMGESELDLFQDRTPRPFINFDKMNESDNNIPFVSKEKQDWVQHYATCALNRIEEQTICTPSWQDDMIRLIKKKIIEDYLKNTSEQQFQIDKISLQVENTML